MPEATFHFPRGFLWGTATAAHQVEGNNINNNWSEWEKSPGRIINDQKSGLACDWWGGRWQHIFLKILKPAEEGCRASNRPGRPFSGLVLVARVRAPGGLQARPRRSEPRSAYFSALTTASLVGSNWLLPG